MNIEQAREYALSLAGVTEDLPYGPDVLVFRVGGKIFMHIWLNNPTPTIAVKLPPDMGIDLRDAYSAITPAWHLNKRHWNDIVIENTFQETQIQEWIGIAYDLVCCKLPRKIKEKNFK